MRRSFRKAVTGAFAVLFLFTAGCAVSQPAARTDTLFYGSGDYTGINPALYEHGEIHSLLFSGLTARDGENKIVPSLAKSWEFDRASRVYTFHLRDDVNWHDGTAFTSADVKFTLEAILNPDNASEIVSNYEDITRIETPDAVTIKLTLKTPNAAMLDYLTVGILPAHLLSGKDLVTDPYNQKPVGTGPYRLTAWDMGQSITMEANTDYFDGTPKIGRIVFQIVTDEKARALRLKAGELDLAQVSPRDAQSFHKEEQHTVYTMRTADYRGILYNFASPLFAAHHELPAALSYAIDRQSILDSVLLGHGEIAYSPLQRGPYNNPEIETYSYSPDKTKSLLEQAGWTRGEDGIYQKDGTRLAFQINCSEGDQVRIDIANICAQQFRQIGAEVTVAVNAEIDWAGQDTYLIGWGSPFDPDDHTYKVFGTDQSANYGSYANAQADTLLRQARETEADADRAALYREFQTVLAEDPPFTFLVYADAVYVSDSRVKGITADTVLGHHGVGIFWNVKDWTLA